MKKVYRFSDRGSVTVFDQETGVRGKAESEGGRRALLSICTMKLYFIAIKTCLPYIALLFPALLCVALPRRPCHWLITHCTPTPASPLLRSNQVNSAKFIQVVQAVHVQYMWLLKSIVNCIFLLYENNWDSWWQNCVRWCIRNVRHILMPSSSF